MLNSILAPLDGTAAAEAGLSWAECAASRSGAALRLLTVVEDDAPDATRRLRQFQTYLTKRRDSIQASGLTVDFELARGAAAEVILASTAGAELTVMTYGTSRWLFGGALDMVLREIARPLVIVRGAGELRPAVTEMRKILLPLDTAGYSKHALAAALQLARNLGASLVLCHIIAPVGIYLEPAEAPPGVARIIEDLMDSARLFLGQCAEEALRQGVPAEIVVTMGNVPREIIRIADSTQAGVIAMATRGNNRLSRIMGSVAYSVTQQVRVPCLLTRAPDVN